MLTSQQDEGLQISNLRKGQRNGFLPVLPEAQGVLWVLQSVRERPTEWQVRGDHKKMTQREQQKPHGVRITFTYILDVSRFSFLSLKYDTVSG